MDLLKNPFNLLKVSPRDSQQRIMETVSGDGQGSISQMRRDAAYTLCDPFKRLRAEVAWLPGLDASQVEILLGRLKKAPEMLIREENLLPTPSGHRHRKVCRVPEGELHHRPVQAEV